MPKKKSTYRKRIWDDIDRKEKKQIFDFGEGYKDFLDKAKTEREAVAEIEAFAKDNGFRYIEDVKDELKAGKLTSVEGLKVYMKNRDKNIALAVLGKGGVDEGLNIVASHIDSPRLDLKQVPLYQTTSLALLDTHYYGGIKNYQWASVPLAMHGVVVRGDGKKIEIKIGEDPEDPVFTVPDLLPHLWDNEQAERPAKDALEGEELNILVGSIPVKKKKENWKKGDGKVKEAVLRKLNDLYGMTEEDFVSAEIEAVPAHKARDVGFDRSMIGAYGQDDRICAYTSMKAIGEIGVPDKTALALFVDKEEIGSEGNTGIQSSFFQEIVAEISSLGAKGCCRNLNTALRNSRAISADVNGGMDPNFPDVHEEKNAAKLSYGICVTKFTGSGGKYESNDASAEYVGFVRKVFNDKGVYWQTGELGKVDEGGGGTIAMYMARYNMDVVDAGPALLSMHSPFEISSKADVYSTYRAYKAFFEN